MHTSYHLYLNHYLYKLRGSYLYQFVMIIARKILGNALSSRPLLRYLDSTQTSGQQAKLAQPIQLSPEAQRALWANHFIKTIISQDFQTTLESPTLREKLLNSPNPTTLHKFDQDIKQEMTGIFTDGVLLDFTVFNQDRISDARLKKQDRRLVFYPSVFVTSKIFTQLHSLSSRIMFQGSYGIGKTISIVFYIYLSNIINKYAFLAAKNEDKDKMLNQYKSLVRTKHLPPYIYKYWYWSINWNSVQLKNFSLQRIFAEQATELTQQEREEIKKCKTIEEAQEKIHQLYEKAKFTHIAVLDQINHAVSFIRKWNSFIEENKALIENTNNTGKIKKVKRINQIYHPTTLLISLSKQFTAINPFNYVLNSSINIERQLLESKNISIDKLKDKEKEKKGKKEKKEKIFYQPLTFQLTGQNNQHNPMRIVTFPFQKQTKTQSGKIHFWKFFWELLEEKIKQQKHTEQNLMKIKLAFFTQACSRPLKLYYRFLHIRQFLQNYKIPNSKNIFTGQIFDEDVKKLISKFEQNSFSQFQKNISTFMQKGDSDFKKTLLRAIHIYAGYCLERKAERLVLDLQLIGYMAGRKGLKEYLLSSEHNKQLIPVQNIPQKSHMIEILWTPQDFIDISQDIIYPKLFTNAFLLPDHQAVGIITNPSYRRTIVETLINLLLKPGALFTFYNVWNERQFNKDGSYTKKMAKLQFITEQILISGKSNFIAFDPRSPQSRSKPFEEHFKSVLDECASNLGLWIVSFPVKNIPEKKDNTENPSVDPAATTDQSTSPQNKQIQPLIIEHAEKKEKAVFNNPSIDFALAKCTINKDNEKEFTIYTFDTTIAFSSVSQKEDNSMALLTLKTIQLKKKIEIRHHILCIRKHCRDTLPVCNHLQICYSDILEMKIKETPDMSTNKKIFDQVKRLIVTLYKGLDMNN